MVRFVLTWSWNNTILHTGNKHKGGLLTKSSKLGLLLTIHKTFLWENACSMWDRTAGGDQGSLRFWELEPAGNPRHTRTGIEAAVSSLPSSLGDFCIIITPKEALPRRSLACLLLQSGKKTIDKDDPETVHCTARYWYLNLTFGKTIRRKNLRKYIETSSFLSGISKGPGNIVFHQ